MTYTCSSYSQNNRPRNINERLENLLAWVFFPFEIPHKEEQQHTEIVLLELDSRKVYKESEQDECKSCEWDFPILLLFPKARHSIKNQTGHLFLWKKTRRGIWPLGQGVHFCKSSDHHSPKVTPQLQKSPTQRGTQLDNILHSYFVEHTQERSESPSSPRQNSPCITPFTPGSQSHATLHSH